MRLPLLQANIQGALEYFIETEDELKVIDFILDFDDIQFHPGGEGG